MKVKSDFKNDLTFGPFDPIEIFIRLLTNRFFTFEPIFTLKVKSAKKIFTTHFLIFRYKDLTVNFVDFVS